MLTIRPAQMQQMAAASPGRPMIQPCPGQATWVEVRLVDAHDAPVPGAGYRVRLPDGSLMTGNLDSEGKVRFDSILPGTCSICFPDIHGTEWQPV